MDHVEPRERPPAFAHASEAELARILDFYEVRWAYEPDSFPIGWNLDGDVIESFSPDFYLPDLDMYVELTTLKQTLVRRKNRDFRMLLLKFGRLALVDELTGSTGQSTPPRLVAVPVIAELAPDAGGASPVLALREAVDGVEPDPASLTVELDPRVLPPVRARRRGRRRRHAAGRSVDSVASGSAADAPVSG